jgi:hypothetical protein
MPERKWYVSRDECLVIRTSVADLLAELLVARLINYCKYPSLMAGYYAAKQGLLNSDLHAWPTASSVITRLVLRARGICITTFGYTILSETHETHQPRQDRSLGESLQVTTSVLVNQCDLTFEPRHDHHSDAIP